MSNYIIAEIGSNFNQSKNIAFKMIRAAKDVGAHAVKFQLFKAKLLYPNNKKMYELFKSIELNPKWIPQLSNYCRKINIDFLSSVFDLESAKLVNKYVKYHKVASSEATNIPLLIYLLKTKKKILFSTGMCDEKDISNFVKLSKKYKNKDIVLMQCGSMYPLPSKHVNLRVLQEYKKKYKCEIGFSDHTIGYDAAICASILGSTFFEKHFTLNKRSKGPDHFFAFEPSQLKKYINKINKTEIILGSSIKQMLPDEKKFGRREGLYFLKDISKGKKIEKKHLYIKQPSIGVRARDINMILGRKLRKDGIKDNPIFENQLLKNK